MNKDITYVIIDTMNYELSSYALERSQQRFPVENILIFSDTAAKWSDRDVVLIPEIQSLEDYNKIVFFELPKHLKTSHALMIQFDGYVLFGDRFSDNFLSYDYIGAPWPHFQSHNVGNGGFSLRSKALVESVQNFLLPSDLSEAEDVVVCRYLRSRLEDKCGLTFAPLSFAETFAYEMKRTKLETFGFHGVFHLPEVMQDDIETLFDVIHPHSVAKHFRSFRDACNKLPADGQRLFHNYCSNNMEAMITQARTIAKEQFLASSS